MSVELPKVKEDFASIVGSLVDHPWKMLQFIIWLDLKLAEYKVYGSMLLDSNFVNIPKWLDFDGSCKSESLCPELFVCQNSESNERVSDHPAAMQLQSMPETDLPERVSDIPVSVLDADTSKSVSDTLPSTPSQSLTEADPSSRVSDRPATPMQIEAVLSKRINDTSPATESEIGLSKPTTVISISRSQNAPDAVIQSENFTDEDSNSAFIPDFRIKTEQEESLNISVTEELPSDSSTNECPHESSGPPMSKLVDGKLILSASCSVDKTLEMSHMCADIPDEGPAQMPLVCADIPDEYPAQMPPICADIPDEGPAQMPPVCTGIPDEGPAQRPSVYADIPDEGPAQMPPVSTGILDEGPAQMLPVSTDTLHSPDKSRDVPREPSCLKAMATKTFAVKRKISMTRPCPFCHKFQASLRRHIKSMHRDEQDVKDALKLSGNAQDLAFAQMRKQGIYEKNMTLLKCDKPLIRERRLRITNGKHSSCLKMCGTCKAFIAAPNLYKHKNNCRMNTLKKTDVPVNAIGNMFNNETENSDFQHMLTVGQLCFGDEFIKSIGRSLLQKNSSKSGRKMQSRNSTMCDMRLLASLCLAFKDTARKDEQELSSASMFDRIFFKYLEEAIQLVSISEGNSAKSGLRQTIGRLLKKCVTVLKATYLGRGQEYRADSIDQFETVLLRRWTSIFGVSEYLALKKRRNKLRQHGQLPMEVKDEAVDSVIELSLKEASCSGDKTQKTPPVCKGIPVEEPALVLHCEDISPDETNEDGSLKSVPPVTHKQGSRVTARQTMDSSIISAVKIKRMTRPCPFCLKFQASLRRHIRTSHKDEQDVQDALKLSGSAQDLAFAQMRKQGIYQKNMSLLKCDKPLIRERRVNLEKISNRLKMCGACKAFIATPNFYKHKNHCAMKVQKKTDVPVNVLGNILNEEPENADFLHMLTKLPTDAVGQLCFGDEFIKTVGHSLWQTNKRNPEKTLSEMRRLASLCLAFKDAARKDEKEVSSESMFDMVYFDYLEEAIQQESDSEDIVVKSDLKQTIGRLLKQCITVMKATYLVRDEDERAVSIDKFESVLMRRWTPIFEDTEYLILRERRNKLRRKGQLPMEVKVEAVDSSIEQSLQEGEVTWSVDKSLEMPPGSSCIGVPDDDPVDALHSTDTDHDVSKEASCLEPGHPVTRGGRRYVHWTNAETTLLRNHFHDIIEDCSKTGLKGSLPGYREIQLFLSKHPTVMQQLEDNKEKLKCIKAKLFNERSKRRKVFAAKLKT